MARTSTIAIILLVPALSGCLGTPWEDLLGFGDAADEADRYVHHTAPDDPSLRGSLALGLWVPPGTLDLRLTWPPDLRDPTAGQGGLGETEAGYLPMALRLYGPDGDMLSQVTDEDMAFVVTVESYGPGASGDDTQNTSFIDTFEEERSTIHFDPAPQPGLYRLTLQGIPTPPIVTWTRLHDDAGLADLDDDANATASESRFAGSDVDDAIGDVRLFQLPVWHTRTHVDGQIRTEPIVQQRDTFSTQLPVGRIWTTFQAFGTAIDYRLVARTSTGTLFSEAAPYFHRQPEIDRVGFLGFPGFSEEHDIHEAHEAMEAAEVRIERSATGSVAFYQYDVQTIDTTTQSFRMPHVRVSPLDDDLANDVIPYEGWVGERRPQALMVPEGSSVVLHREDNRASPMWFRVLGLDGTARAAGWVHPHQPAVVHVDAGAHIIVVQGPERVYVGTFGGEPSDTVLRHAVLATQEETLTLDAGDAFGSARHPLELPGPVVHAEVEPSWSSTLTEMLVHVASESGIVYGQAPALRDEFRTEFCCRSMFASTAFDARWLDAGSYQIRASALSGSGSVDVTFSMVDLDATGALFVDPSSDDTDSADNETETYALKGGTRTLPATDGGIAPPTAVGSEREHP